MTVLALILIGILTGLTTVLFGFGGGFVTVPVIVWADAAAGGAAGTVAVATSAVVMVINASVATSSTHRSTLARLRGRLPLLFLLALGGLLGAILALAVPAEITSWGFVLYLTLTIVDVLARPGFLRPAGHAKGASTRIAIPTVLGTPIGAVAAFLGVGGSVMTVPVLRRSGLPMGQATALANPLTLTISVPASLVFLAAQHTADIHGAVFAVGIVDLGAAALLLLGAVPVIVALRRRPPRIRDGAHAWTYVGLLLLVLVAMLASLI
ncbi:sulfite exporter TauE/SafE family protein [Ruania zhangjianzhongii]|uniref:sulfite exporter TauE/SafE family protein n=1 Tax=Ruania zhangjianzhongii TaxID=2603206 RepID=UPI0011C9B66D|nr:sulfite exporter TauE/SafE family protein [Ruania zhangjianzhongii]